MNTTNNRQTQFVTLAIGATAQQMGITATELHNRLKHHGLVKRLLLDCYDTLHAESIDGVVWNVQEALNILYNSRTFALLSNPDSGLCLQSDEYILNDLLKELEV